MHAIQNIKGKLRSNVFTQTVHEVCHKKIDLKVFVVVLPKEGWARMATRAHPSFGITTTFKVCFLVTCVECGLRAASHETYTAYYNHTLSLITLTADFYISLQTTFIVESRYSLRICDWLHKVWTTFVTKTWEGVCTLLNFYYRALRMCNSESNLGQMMLLLKGHAA